MKLRPCHCGGKVELKSGNEGYMIVCPECSEGSDLYGCDEALVRAWNNEMKSEDKRVADLTLDQKYRLERYWDSCPENPDKL